jgi:hypothetical protein
MKIVPFLLLGCLLTVSQAHAQASTCPATDFDGFVQTYANRMSVQQNFTRWPLKMTYIDTDAQPEPQPVTEELGEQAITYPLLMDMDRARSEGATVTITSDAKGGGSLKYSKPDTDEQILYMFERDGACWQLVGIDDQSL